MKVIQVNQSKVKIQLAEQKRIETAFRKIITYLKKKKLRNKYKLFEKKELTLVYLSSADMKKINKQYRGKNKATDILSFVSADPRSIGELLICPEVLRLQAERLGHSRELETLYMLIHGLLHLLDYDHERSTREEKLMFRIQDECFRHLV